VAVLVHGGTVPMFTWDDTVPALVDSGRRVLRYDMFGRGYSDRPRTSYDRSLYFEQLDNLLDALGIADPVDLVGFSLGGATVANYASRRPDRVRSLTLISPVGYGFSVPAVFRVPVLGEILIRLIGLRILEGRANALFGDSPHAEDFSRWFSEQRRFTGFTASLLSMFRSDALGDYRDAYAAIGGHRYPVLLAWGDADTEVTRDVIDTIRGLIPRAEFHVVPDVGHGIVFQRPAEVNELLTRFLER
jgi:pimeloyl-ACP methyl ester carboxylesterase